VRHPVDTPERRIAALASRSHGVVTREALLSAGITLAEIRHRLRTGALIREHSGVYRVGHRALSVEADYLAAVLACGSGALLRGCAAGFLFGLLKGSQPPAEVLTLKRHKPSAVRTRRTRSIHPGDATEYRGIPITTVPRTMVDLAAELSQGDLGRVVHEAGIRFGVTPDGVEAVLARRPNSPGTAKLRQVLWGDAPLTLSRLEDRFLELLKEERLPLPEMNRPAGSHRVDCRWPKHRLTVELDGYRYHSSRHAWERDRRREREARARDDEFRRYTYGDVFEEPKLMLAELRVLL
jgi:hypothetical protein